MEDKDRYTVQDMETGEYVEMTEEEIKKTKLILQRCKDRKDNFNFLLNKN